MRKFEIELANDYQEWYEQASPHSTFTIFSDPVFLSTLPETKVYGYIKKGNEKFAYFAITLRNNKCFRPGFVIHNGLIISNFVFSQKIEKTNEIVFRLNEVFAEYLDREYSSIDLALHPYIRDIRPYLWLNYHSPREEDKCKVYVRYTSYLTISDLRERNEFDSKVFKGLAKGRRYDIKKARKYNAKTILSKNINLFLDFYYRMMLSQGIQVKDTAINTLERIISTLISEGKAQLFVTYFQEKPIYATVWGWDKHRAYYLYGAGDPEIIIDFKGTICCWDAILWLAKEKRIKKVDFEGVNSPYRGFFKLSFGGELLNYYWIKKS